MAKKEATAISIKPLEEGHVKITVRGTAPLLVHAWDDKAIGMISIPLNRGIREVVIIENMSLAPSMVA